jgi:TonB family protein
MSAVIWTDGHPCSIRIIRSFDPNYFDPEATRALKQWRFRPATLGGTPVAVNVTVEMEFH